MDFSHRPGRTNSLGKNSFNSVMVNYRWFNKSLWLRRNESGNVESALVLIPLMILFLSVLQIAASVMGRTIGGDFAQSQISRTGLYTDGQFLAPLNPPTSLMDSKSYRVQLPGGGAVLTLSQTHKIPLLTPLLASNDKFNATGIVIDENS
jgi:hypothetical protein